MNSFSHIISLPPTDPKQPTDESAVDAFHWLMILGFPPNVAAAQVMPELFTSDDSMPRVDAQPYAALFRAAQRMTRVA